VGKDRSPGGAPVRVSDWSLGRRVGGIAGSGGRRNDHDPAERLDDPVSPGPAGRETESSEAAATGESGRNVQDPESQQLRFGVGEVAVEGEELQPGDQVGGDRGKLDPGLVDRVFPGWEPAESGFLGGLDAFLNPGMGAVPGL
jgi:hypothetical protein